MNNKPNKHTEDEFEDITNLIDRDEFEQIKMFVLEKGDRMTYRNFDSHNPHYNFGSFDIFLGADIGQKNINNDPQVSNFNQLIIADRNSDIQYYELIIVRFGDLINEKKWIKTGMKEGNVYLVDEYDKELPRMKNSLPNYLNKIKEEIKRS